MQASLTYFLLFIALTAKAQLSNVITNTTEKDKTESTIYRSFYGKYDFIIAYTAPSYWTSNISNYKILALKNNRWFYISYYSKRKRVAWSKPKISERPFDFHKAKTLMDSLDQHHFWSLNRDSLNIKTRDNGDGTVTELSLYDATNHKFEIITKSNFTIVECYAPEYFLEELPKLTIRKIFINCRNLFLKAIKNN